MVESPDDLLEGGPDRRCATCGHEGASHRVLETELPGATVIETFCEECDALCDFVPVPE